jgi:hypothetical protein
VPLHKRYERVRGLVDAHFVSIARRAHAAAPELDRIEIWHDALEAALAADRDYPNEPGEDWEGVILESVEKGLPRPDSVPGL